MQQRCCVLYNPKAGNGHSKETAHRLDALLPDSKMRYMDLTVIQDYSFKRSR